MPVEIIDFDARRGDIDGLFVVTVKQVTDDRGTIREVFRRSAFESVGVRLDPFQQINVTTSRHGAVRGMHAEAMTKLVTLASGEAHGGYVDLRPDSPTFGVSQAVELRPGVQVLIPAGVANGFQALGDDCVYLYCFDAEWVPGMPGSSCSPIDPELGIGWPIPVDPTDADQLSAKDAAAPTLAELRNQLGVSS